jgi:hypothetical protein
MDQLIIFIHSDVDSDALDEGWPQFLDTAEKMPGLLKESLTKIDQSLYGSVDYLRIYTFSFPDQNSLNRALQSDYGERAGSILHRITGGKVTILTGSYQSDSLERIRSFSSEHLKK